MKFLKNKIKPYFIILGMAFSAIAVGAFAVWCVWTFHDLSMLIVMSILAISALIMTYFFYRLGRNSGYIEAYWQLMNTCKLPYASPPGIFKNHELQHYGVEDPDDDIARKLKGQTQQYFDIGMTDEDIGEKIEREAKNQT